MRFVRYLDGESARLGALVGDRVVDLAAASEEFGGGTLPPTLLELVESGEAGLRYARGLFELPEVTAEDSRFSRPLDGVRLLAPLDPPRGNVLAIGRNYAEHAKESALARGEEVERPTVFTKAQTSITGPYDDVEVDPRVTQQADWEVELGVVIGRAGKNIDREHAFDHVFGYTVVNDISARDIQNGWGGQFFKGKSLDGFCPTGPCIVTVDEIPDPQNLRLILRVDGEVMQDANTEDMIFPVDELVSQLSLGMTLLPGALVATGTPAGVGFARKPPIFLQPGNVVEAEVEGIGVLRNRII